MTFVWVFTTLFSSVCSFGAWVGRYNAVRKADVVDSQILLTLFLLLTYFCGYKMVTSW